MSENNDGYEIMEANMNKVVAIIGDLLNDSSNVHLLKHQLANLGVNGQYFMDICNELSVISIVLILNENSVYNNDINDFMHYVIRERIPIIVIYTNISDNAEIHDSVSFTDNAIKLWKEIPSFYEERYMVPTVHILLSDLKQIIRNRDFEKGTMLDPSDYYLLKKKSK